MAKKWKILGIQTNLDGFVVKTKFKQILRSITYSRVVQEIICSFFKLYMWLVYLSCKRIWVNQDVVVTAAKNQKPLIISCWHNRLMMMPFITLKPKKASETYDFMTLASKHGDGRFIGFIMRKFNLISIYGSTRDKRKPQRGIDFSSMRQILEGLKKGYAFGITPDGPRGPSQQINGETVNIARISGAGILPTSYSCSRFKVLNTWDKFKVPLPFSTLCFHFDDKAIFVPKNASVQEVEEIKKEVEMRSTLMQEKADKITGYKKITN
jgi:hypothetical protein